MPPSPAPLTPRAQLLRLGWRPAWALAGLSFGLHILVGDVTGLWQDAAFALIILGGVALEHVRPGWGVVFFYLGLAPLLAWLARTHGAGWTLSPDLAGYSAALVLPAITIAVSLGFRGVVAFLVYGLGLGALGLPFDPSQAAGVAWNFLLALGLGWQTVCLLRGAERALEELRRSALQDPLTGLGNRRAFDAALDEAWASRRSTLAVVLLDLDGLKAVNDSRGHEAGDRLLSGFADALRVRLDAGATAYRLGGDEYAVLCDETGLRAVREAVAEAAGQMRRSSFPEMGASVGSAAAAEVRTIGALVRLADERMYTEKRGKPQRRTGVGSEE